MNDRVRLSPAKAKQSNPPWAERFPPKGVSVGRSQRTIRSLDLFSIPHQFINKTVRRQSLEMIFVIWTCYWFVFAGTQIPEMKIPVQEPPSPEEIFNAYFNNSESNRTKKSISDKFNQDLERSKSDSTKNLTDSDRVVNISEGDIFGPVRDHARPGVFKNYILAPTESGTHKYPTAVWSYQNYEKLKSSQRNRLGNSAHVYGRRLNNLAFEKSQRSRSKKWKEFRLPDLAQRQDYRDLPYDGKTDFADKFLERSLRNYLISSNLKEAIGHVSVKTFSEILKNVTSQKSQKKLQVPYDQNKELRMKFREEVILKRKNETKPQEKFLERQLQKRLEKARDAFNERNKQKILANAWKYANLNRKSYEVSKEKKNKTEEETMITPERVQITSPRSYTDDFVYTTIKSTEATTNASTEGGRGTIKYRRPWYTSTESSKYYESSGDEEDDRVDLLKLTAEESSYYSRRQYPSLTFVGQSEKPSELIPGTPYADYPVYSFPPPTKFKCPKFKDGKPKMIADRETRCQVFYVCTGDGPETAMLCPNGTMFNENFLVCDWWYNVQC